MTYAGDEQTPAELNASMPPDNARHGDADLRAQSTDTENRPPKKGKKAPSCIVSGEELDTGRMLRFVIGPGDVLYPDFADKLPGTAYWCNLYRPTLDTALRDNAFARVAGKPVVIPTDIHAQIERGLRQQALAMVSMARKAGLMSTGAEKSEQVIRSGKAGIYLTAAQKDADTRMKLTFLAKKCRIVDLFDSDELSTASGANKVVHAVMTRGGSAERFFDHVKRLNLFLSQTNLAQAEEDRND